MARRVEVARGRRTVLRGVDLTLRAGEVVALLGPNGAGKSTLLDVLGGVLAPASGTVERAGRVATVRQSAGLASRTVLGNVELALAWWGVPRGERRSRAVDALDRLGIADLAKRQATTLSGGQRRRVHLARGLSLESDVLLLDEPFAGLDPATHELLRTDIAAALRTADRAVLVVVHDRDDAWALADRLVVLLDGTVAANGPPDDVLRSPGSPAVARLLGYDGELRHGDTLTLTRAAQVSLAPAAELSGIELTGTVRRLVASPDGARIEVVTADGTVWAQVRGDRPQIGARVGLRIEQSVQFPAR